MDIKDTVSVIIPIYNVELYLRRCLDSVLAQTYQNLEIILVDDGSPDRCGEICDEYAKADSRVRVIHQTNQGLSAARNAGIDVATGSFLAFIDSDDYVEERMIEVLLDNLRTYQAQISSCEHVDVYEGRPVPEAGLENSICELTPEQALAKFLISTKVDVITWNKLYERKLFSDIRFPVGKLYEDHFTTYRLLDRARKIVHTQAQFYYYCKRCASISGMSFSPRTFQLREGLDEECPFIKKKYPGISKQVDLGYLFWLTVIYGKMIQGDAVDAALQKEIRGRIRRAAVDILRCGDFGFVRKIQFYVLMLSPRLYRRMYLWFIARNR